MRFCTLAFLNKKAAWRYCSIQPLYYSERQQPLYRESCRILTSSKRCIALVSWV